MVLDLPYTAFMLERAFVERLYYDWSPIEGYDCPIKIVVAMRGIGKTFPKVKMSLEDFITNDERFVYVVEQDDDVKELSKNNGEKFWSKIIEYYEVQNTSRKRYFYNKITSLELDSEEDNKELRKSNAKISGSTIKINGQTAGYILDMYSFANIKRNNFVKIRTIIIDEFISEKMDKRSLSNPERIVSIVQSVARLDNVRIYLLGNSIRKDDPILARMGFKIDNFGFYFLKDKYGLLAVLHYVDPKQYKEFEKRANESVAGRLAKMLKCDNEERNEFKEDLPKDRRLTSFKYKKGGFQINLVKDDVIVTLRETIFNTIACVPFARSGATNLYCLNEREQGFKLGYHIIHIDTLRKTISSMIKANNIYYYSEIEYQKLKYIIKGDR